jgi:putative ABC transport system permease protein
MGLREFGRRLAYLFHKERHARDLEEEMRLHIDLRAQRLQRQGVEQAGAGHAAQRQFGNRAYLKETSSEMWGWTAWERLIQDARHALRSLRKTPAFTVVAVLTLALGLGMNTAVFSVVNAVVIRTLPYQEPDRLISLWEEYTTQGPNRFSSSGSNAGGAGGPRRTTVSVANLLDYRQSRAFTGLAGFAYSQQNLTGDGAPERLLGEAVTANYFGLLGVQPEQGRAFLPEEDSPDASPVVVITHDFRWRRFGGDTNVLGRNLMLDARPYQVIGVLPRSFQSVGQFGQPNRVEFFVPAAYSKELLSNYGRGDHEISVLGRLRPGASVRGAQSELEAISAGLAKRFPDSNQGMRAAIAPLQDDLIRRVTDSLRALLGASGLIVLITCVNVANLLLVRAIARRHETSVRFALGASRLRIVRQFLAESLLVAAAGCGAGILLGEVLMRLLVNAAPQDIPRLDSVTMDWRVFAVATAIATITGIGFGIVPAWQASRTRPAESLKSSERKTGGKSQARWRSALTVAEVALSMILLVGAGLMLKDFVQVMGVDLGFQPDRVLAMNIALPELHYRTADMRLRFFQQLEERVTALPGVRRVAYANAFPLRGGWGTGIEVEDGNNGRRDADSQAVSPGYFETLGIPLLRGRLLVAGDRAGEAHVAVVNQTFVRQFFPNVDAIGHRLRRGSKAPWVTVVGVVNDIRRAGKTAQMTPQVYLPAAQTDIYPVRLSDFAVRTAGDPRQLINAIQQQVWAVDKDQPVTAVHTMDEIITLNVAERRFQTLLLLLFAAVAVGLATIGIFGVLSYSVSQRTSELGIRIALGAQPASILGLVMKQAGWLIGAGVGLGLGGAYILTRYLQSLLFNVKPTDWRTYAAAVLLLAAVSAAASLIPARRGSRVDPIVALRYE